MLPIDPRGVESHRRDESRNWDGTDTEVISQQRRDFPFVSITKCLTSSVGLEERGCSISFHFG